MKIPPSQLSLSAALALALAAAGPVACTEGDGFCSDGCDEDGADDDGQGDPEASDDGPRIGRDDAYGTVSSATGGTNSMGDCADCCDGPHELGDDTFFMRVDDSNSFASPLLTRALLPRWDGERPLPVRAHEYLNFYAPRVDAADGVAFATNDGAMPIAVGALNRVFALQVAVRHVPKEEVVGRTIALVIDTSPSAAAAVDELLGSVDAVFGQVAPSDVIAVYTWATDPEARIVRPFATVKDRSRELDVVRSRVQEELARRDEGATLAEPLRDALARTRELVGDATGDGGTVVLVSDGTSGIDVDTVAYAQSESDATNPIRIVGVGVGDPLYYSDEVLDLVTDASGGAYLYFDGSPEARDLLEKRFRELSETAAVDVRLRVELPESVTPVTAAGGDVQAGSSAAVRGQNLGWGGTMTFYEPLEWTGAEGTECDTLTWHVVRGRDDQAVELDSGTITVGDVFGGLHQTGSMVQAAAVVAAADALRGPTLSRLRLAFTAFEAAKAYDPDLWEGSSLPALCATLESACEKKKLDCGSCDFGPSGEEQP